jgi:hypothetical protein
MARTVSPMPVVRPETPVTPPTTARRSQFVPLLETRSDVYRVAITQLERYAKHDQVHVLLVGESGTGKSIFAEHLHACSPRAVVERKEISPLGADRPVSVDVRLVAATNVPLHTLADDGTFLPDLLARLDGFVVRIPPLRERREDIPLLATHLVAKHAPEFGYAAPPAIEDRLMSALCEAEWPGNVRELDVAIRRLLIECDGVALGVGMVLCVVLRDPVVTICGYALIGLAVANIIPISYSLAAQVPSVSPSVTLASIATIGFIGFVAGPPLIGLLSALLSLRAALSVMVVLGVLVAVLSGSLAVR